MTLRLLRPSAAALAALASVKTGDARGNGATNISELSIYDSEETRYLEYKAPKRSQLEKRIGVVRRRVWDISDKVEEYFVSVKERYKSVRDKAIEYSTVVTQTMDTETNIIPKIAAVSLIGVIGFAAAGGSRTRQLLFPVIGATSMAAVCFPTITTRVVIKPGVRVYHQLVEQLRDLKDRAMQRIYNTETSHAIEETKGAEVIEINTPRVDEGLEPMDEQQEIVSEGSKDVLLSVSEEEMADKVQSIQGDMGQSDPSDSDMYTTHSRN